jgi:quercetin 2,3-dioxygenase
MGEFYMTNPDPHPDSSRASDCPARPDHPVIERIAARTSTLGQGMTIRRALPARERRMIGAWCFFDHAGPLDYEAGQGIAVGPHPHIGLQTFSWMIEGRMRHSDSLGNVAWIEPGQVNLMTAGKGISHAEESDPNQPGRVQLAQLWIALPDARRDCEPAFVNYPELPVSHRGDLELTLLVGEHGDRISPVRVHSRLVAMDIRANQTDSTTLALDTDFEYGLMVLEESATVDGERFEPGELAYLGTGRSVLDLAVATGGRVLLIGGEPFDEDILLWWNFVARTPEEIEQAAADWQAGQRFGGVEASETPSLQMPSLEGVRIKPRS